LKAGKRTIFTPRGAKSTTKYIGVGAMFGVVGALIAGALTDDDNGMYKFEPIEPAQALKLLEDLKLSE